MFRITKYPSSGSFIQCLAKIKITVLSCPLIWTYLVLRLHICTWCVCVCVLHSLESASLHCAVHTHLSTLCSTHTQCLSTLCSTHTVPLYTVQYTHTVPLYTVQYTHSASLHCAVHTQCLSTLCSTHTVPLYTV